MKAFDPEKILSVLCQDITKTSNPLNATDNLIYLRAILDALHHISEQLEDKQTVEYCKCSNVGPNAIEPDMPVDGNGNCTYCGKFAKRDYGTKSES